MDLIKGGVIDTMAGWAWTWPECDTQQLWWELFELWEAEGIKNWLGKGRRVDEETQYNVDELPSSSNDPAQDELVLWSHPVVGIRW